MVEMIVGATIMLAGIAIGFNAAVIMAARGRMDDDG